jgi:hypothetical protein
MSKTRIVYLYFYTDSVAFPRIEDQSLEQTWPFLLKDRLEVDCGVRVYPCLRGQGGATIGEIRSIFLRDIGYFRGQGNGTASFVIFNTGVVDAAPQPFTFCLRKLAGIPVIGPKLWHYVQKPLVPHRALMQRIWSYRRTGPRRFRQIFNHMIRQVKRLEMQAISIDTPLTPVAMEARSPNLRESIREYNDIKHENVDVTHVAMDWVRDEHYLGDGHHFKPEGHHLLAEQLLKAVRTCLGQ